MVKMMSRKWGPMLELFVWGIRVRYTERQEVRHTHGGQRGERKRLGVTKTPGKREEGIRDGEKLRDEKTEMWR